MTPLAHDTWMSERIPVGSLYKTASGNVTLVVGNSAQDRRVTGVLITADDARSFYMRWGIFWDLIFQKKIS